MKILHICNDFSYSKVHTNLYYALDMLGVKQIIYHPLRTKQNVGKNVFSFKVEESRLIYSDLLRKYHRVLFRKKIDFLYQSLKSQIDLSKLTMQHATTLFSDGALAYKIYKKYKIPYTVTLRNTDVNLFLKFRPDLYSLAGKILRNADNVIFISPSLKTLFFKNIYFSGIEKDIYRKIHVIPNGIDNYWIQNIKKPSLRDSINFLFIGRFDTNKNVLNLIQALENCRNIFPQIQVKLVGGGGNLHDKVLKKIEGKDWIEFLGPIYEKEILKEKFRSCDFFAMPSIYETFGLVYIEALSQGLPILYTKGQGVDGVIDGKVGVSTSPLSVSRIETALKELIEERYELVGNIAKLDFSQFNWNNIAKIYYNLLER